MTTQTRFTPGPYSILGKSSEWRAEPKRAGINATFSQMSVIAPDGRELALVVEVGDLEQKWDAHLFASAPDLYAALERVLDVYGLGDKGHLEIYEDAAEDFRKATGRMAPGKDSSPQAYVSEEHNAETSTMWAEFCTKRRDDAFVAARAALRKARGEA